MPPLRVVRDQTADRVRDVTRDEAGKSGPVKVVAETVVLVLVAVALAVVVKTFFVQAFYIPSASMEPGLQGGPGAKANDRILVEKPSYWFGSGPSRGDIVVFKDPGNWLPAEDDAAPDDAAEDLWLTALAHHFSLDWSALPTTSLPTLLVRAAESWRLAGARDEPEKLCWEFARDLSLAEVPGNHLTMMSEHADTTARAVERWLDSLNRSDDDN